MSGTGPSSATSRRTAVVRKSRRSGSSGGSASTSATLRTGEATTGPTPGLISRSTPATTSGSTMSEKRIAASTPCRRTGCRVISVTRSGSWQAVSIAVPARSARYSGSERPAWRMNHTGVRVTGCPRAARTRSESAGAGAAESAAGRFAGLHDPAGHGAWDGTTRCVGYVSASTDEHMVDDSMFSEVAWSWLTDALVETGASHRAVGGTVTRTASTRFGDLAGPEHTVDVEIRASWTAGDDALDRPLAAFLDVLGNAAGLPPPGVHLLGPSDRDDGGTL